jgi:uncharacterized protein (DUF1330 family)
MAAYIGAQLDVKTTHWQKAYGPKAGTLMQHYGGKVLAGAGAIWSPRVRVPRGMAACR